MKFLIDFAYLLGDLLPVKLRTRVRYWWLYAALKGVRVLHADFLDLVDRINKEAALNAQVIVLESYLNDLFDDQSRRIVINDADDLLDYVELYLISEVQPPTEAYLLSEIPPGDSLILYNRVEHNSGIDFIVYLPLIPFFDETPLLGVVDKYKFAGTRYKLVIQ